jgi:hypothetical protein
MLLQGLGTLAYNTTRMSANPQSQDRHATHAAANKVFKQARGQSRLSSV